MGHGSFKTGLEPTLLASAASRGSQLVMSSETALSGQCLQGIRVLCQSIPPQPRQRISGSARSKNCCTITGMSCQQPCEMQCNLHWGQWKMTRRMTRPRPSRLDTKHSLQSCGLWDRESSSWRPVRRCCSNSSKKFKVRSARCRMKSKQPRKTWRKSPASLPLRFSSRASWSQGCLHRQMRSFPVGPVPGLAG